jgi:hypothetical protein
MEHNRYNSFDLFHVIGVASSAMCHSCLNGHKVLTRLEDRTIGFYAEGRKTNKLTNVFLYHLGVSTVLYCDRIFVIPYKFVFHIQNVNPF